MLWRAGKQYMKKQETRCPLCVRKFLDKSHSNTSLLFPSQGTGATSEHTTATGLNSKNGGAGEPSGCQSRHLSLLSAV